MYPDDEEEEQSDKDVVERTSPCVQKSLVFVIGGDSSMPRDVTEQLTNGVWIRQLIEQLNNKKSHLFTSVEPLPGA